MRPIDKGEAPYKAIKEYREAIPYLRQRIGLYCSYCEMAIKHVPEVEHIVSRKHGGDWTAWSNLLLSCKYCNTRKLAQTTPKNRDDYLWPDEYNTGIAFTYINGIPQINKKELRSIDATGQAYGKAEKIYEMVKLGPSLDGKRKDMSSDARFLNRNASYYKAMESLNDWKLLKNAEDKYKEAMKRQIIRTAVSEGFFSVWMTVFSEEPQILTALIDSYPGTNKKYFDKTGKIKKVL